MYPVSPWELLAENLESLILEDKGENISFD
jgi:hypothetical protein